MNWGLLEFLIFFTLRWINNSLQRVWWKITGVDAAYQSSVDKSISKKTVQVLRIILKHPEDELLIPITDNNYICWHEGFYPMEYIMKQNVSLHIARDGAEIFFIETDPQVDIFNLRRHPFAFFSQNRYAQKLIRVHATDLIEYAEALEKPTMDVTWILHSARCGSTAMAQALATLPCSMTFSEFPWLTQSLPTRCMSVEDTRTFYNSSQFKAMVKACIKIQLLHFKDCKHICWKMIGPFGTWTHAAIIEEYPQHKFIRMIRDGKESVPSYYKLISHHSGTFNQIMNAYNIFPSCLKFIDFLHRFIPLFCNGYLTSSMRDYLLDGDLTIFELLYACWLTNIATMVELETKYPMMVIDFNYFFRDKRASLEKVLRYLGQWSAENLELALESYNHDSQANSAIAKENLKQRQEWQRNENSVRKATVLARSFNLPEFDTPINRSHLNGENWELLID